MKRGCSDVDFCSMVLFEPSRVKALNEGNGFLRWPISILTVFDFLFWHCHTSNFGLSAKLDVLGCGLGTKLKITPKNPAFRFGPFHRAPILIFKLHYVSDCSFLYSITDSNFRSIYFFRKHGLNWWRCGTGAPSIQVPRVVRYPSLLRIVKLNSNILEKHPKLLEMFYYLRANIQRMQIFRNTPVNWYYWESPCRI